MILHEPRRKSLSLPRLNTRHGRISAVCVSIACFLRGLPLFFAAKPKTPLRVLCIIAFDAMHVLRHSQRLPRRQIAVLADLLDFGACANAALDGKPYCKEEYKATRQRLDEAGFGPLTEHYVTQLQQLEGQRPSVGGDQRQFEDIRAYREAVAQLSLQIMTAATAAAAAQNPGATESAVPACHSDTLQVLFRIVMLCQIIDDVVDYRKDAAAGLPSFLTASASLPLAIRLTSQAARDYANRNDSSGSRELFPFRMALQGVSIVARMIIRIGHWYSPIRSTGDSVSFAPQSLQRCSSQSATISPTPCRPPL